MQSTHIDDMGRLFLFTKIFSILLIILFFPIFISWNLHFDLKEKKYAFCLKAYKKIKLWGGYATLYNGGVALHLSKKKAVLLPYNEIHAKRKKFSFNNSFKVISVKTTIESTIEKLPTLYFLNSFLNIVKKIAPNLNKFHFSVWISEKENQKLTAKCSLFFNNFMLLIDLLQFLWGKIIKIWQEKTKKSII